MREQPIGTTLEPTVAATGKILGPTDLDRRGTSPDDEPRPSARLASGTLLSGRYRIHRLLGTGGMGTVYQAYDERLDLTVAIKVLRSDQASDPVRHDRFHHELLAGRRISHRGVVRIHDFDRDGDLSYITMDFVGGCSLADLLDREGRLPVGRAEQILRQLAAAVAAAHHEGVVHRDLKPANILLDDHGDAHITDFGIALTSTSSDLTRTGDVLGTPEYLAPEQAQGRPVDHRADLYALGLIFFRMVTGESPFRGAHLGERLAERIAGAPRRLSETGHPVPPYLEAVTLRCLARDPNDRYQSAEELLADLEARSLPRRRPARVVRWLAAIVSLMLLAAMVLAATTFVSPVRSPPAGETALSSPAARYAVAVLPLTGDSGQPEWLSGGLAEMLASALSESPDLRVTDSLRVFRTLEDLRLPADSLTPADLRLVAELLDVDRLIVGRIWSAGGIVHAELQIVVGRRPEQPGRIVRGEASGERGPFDLARELAEQTRRTLEAAPPIHAGEPSSTPAAFDAYTRGLQELSRGESLAALPELRKAVAEAPDFAAAWVSLARTYQSLGEEERALDAARRAVELEPQGRIGRLARARLAMLSGEPERGRALLAELVESYPHDIEARMMLSEADGEAGRFEPADAELATVLAEDPNHPRAWYLRAKYAILGGHARRAADEYLVQALVIQNRLDDPQGKADVLNALGAARSELGEPDEAMESYRQAAALRREIGDQRGYAVSLANLARVEQTRGDFDRARTHLDESRTIRERLGYREGAANLENQLGQLEEQQGLYREALTRYARALEMRRQLGDQRAIAESYDNVGFAYFVLGEYDNAELHWQQALSLYRDDRNPEGETFALQHLGMLARARGDWRGALASFLGALRRARDLRLEPLQALSTAQIGRVLERQGRFSAALDAYRDAKDLYRPFGEPRGMTEFTLFEAETQITLHRVETAARRLEEAEAWIVRSKQREHRAEKLRLEAEIARIRGDTDAAWKLADRAREEAEISGSETVELSVFRTLGRIALARRDPRTAAELLGSAVERAERIGHAVLRVETSADLATALVELGRSQEAEATLRQALEVATTHRPLAASGRLHLLLADLLDARGEREDAARELDRARHETEWLRSGLRAEDRAAFDHLPGVRDLLRRSAPDAATPARSKISEGGLNRPYRSAAR